MDLVQEFHIENPKKFSVEQVMKLLKDLPNPRGFGKRFYDDGIFSKSGVLRRNQKGRSQHKIQLTTVDDKSIVVQFTLKDFRLQNFINSAIFTLFAIGAYYLIGKLLVLGFFLIPSIGVFVLALFSPKLTQKWINTQVQIIETTLRQ